MTQVTFISTLINNPQKLAKLPEPASGPPRDRLKLHPATTLKPADPILHFLDVFVIHLEKRCTQDLAPHLTQGLGFDRLIDEELDHHRGKLTTALHLDGHGILG